MAGGKGGQPGLNRVVRADGRVEVLEHIGQTQMRPGDVFEIDTPGLRPGELRRRQRVIGRRVVWTRALRYKAHEGG